MSYHLISCHTSYHIILYHITSYHTIYHIISYIISYHIPSPPPTPPLWGRISAKTRIMNESGLPGVEHMFRGSLKRTPGHAMSAQLVDELFAMQCDPDTDDNHVFTALDAFHLSFTKLRPVHHIVSIASEAANGYRYGGPFVASIAVELCCFIGEMHIYIYIYI